eukprot:CAMPEP_0170477332 /NCGR_PEP_ID=MMETSP0123-20130129/18633_1 /TAXON_ID=182087 /ORGANISM="Favella ehrenbergii, Strain Fehren 1" /LENGTH=73 /DNA_ID=CAMNT_0010749037 /DNA_START=3291 /DNA_END=3512 /DNA_ORIENTATION=+
MDHLPVVDVLHAEADLSKPIKDLLLGEWPPTLVLDSLLQITAIAVVHDDAQLAFLGLEHFNECHDVGVVEGLE